MKTFILLFLTSLAAVTEINAQAAYRTRASGNWNDTATWEKWNGLTWQSPLSSTDYPGLADSVYIQLLHTVTLTQDHSCRDLSLNNGLGARLQLNDHFLIVNGRMALFAGLASFPVTYTNLNIGASIDNGTNNSGLIRLSGAPRVAFRASEWTSNLGDLNLEILLASPSSVVTAETSLKVGRLAVINGKLEVAGDLFVDNGTSGGDVYIDATAALQVQNTLQRSATGGAADTVMVNGTLTLGAGANQALQATMLQVSAGGTLEMRNSIPYSFSVTNYTLQTGSRLVYSGNVINQPTGNEFPYSGVKSLVVNTTGSISLANSKTVRDTLIMTSGNINLSAGDSLTLGVNSMNVLQRSSGVITGKFNRHITALSLGATLFPVGSASHYRPLLIDFLGVPLNSGNISVVHADLSGGTDITPFNDGSFTINRRSNMHWDVNVNDGLRADNLILRADISGQDGITDSSQIRLIGSTDNGLNFSLLGGLTLPLLGTMGSLGGIELDSNDFSVYVGGNLTTNPLPVKFTAFSGKFTGNDVMLQWQTAAEINSDYFELQRSADGKRFVTIASVKAAGTRGTVTDYQYTDVSPFNGANYYRLAQFDIDRRSEYSNVIRVNATDDDRLSTLLVGPSPVDDELKIILDQNTYSSVRVIDMLGQVRIVKHLDPTVVDLSLDMTVLRNGIYFVQFMSGDKPAETRRIYKL